MKRIVIVSILVALLANLGAPALGKDRCGPDHFDVFLFDYKQDEASVGLELRLDKCYPGMRFTIEAEATRKTANEEVPLTDFKKCPPDRRCRLILDFDHPPVEYATYEGQFRFKGRGSGSVEEGGSVTFAVDCLAAGIETRCHLPIP